MREYGWESGGSFLPEQKIEFVIGRDAISRCFEGLTCTLQSLLRGHSITFSISPPPSLFLCKFGRIARPIFSCGEVCTPRPSVGPPVPPTFIGCRHSGLYYHNSTRSRQVLDIIQHLNLIPKLTEGSTLPTRKVVGR